MSTETLSNLLYSILQYNTLDNQFKILWRGYFKLTGSADFSNIYTQMENVTDLIIDYFGGSDD